MRSLVGLMALVMLSGCSYDERARDDRPEPDESLASYMFMAVGEKDGTRLILKKRPAQVGAFEYDNSLNRPSRSWGWGWKTLGR